MTTQTPVAPAKPAASRSVVRDLYDGPAGAFTAFTGVVTGHGALAGRLIGPKAFDVRGCGRLLDAACGNGRYSKHLLPLADGTFDAAVCGWVLEHFTDPRPALREMARVLAPRGKMLLLTTEDTLLG